jgi:hypothetical protein
LIKLFQKFAQVEGAKPSSRSAERETPPPALSFVNFSFAPMVSKEKWLRNFKIKMGVENVTTIWNTSFVSLREVRATSFGNF